jgi:hypothetical protein
MERRVEQEAAKSLARKTKEVTDYSGLCERTLTAGSKKLKATEKLTFHFLQRQFEGKEVRGFRGLVSTGRFVLSTLRRFRGKA